MIMNNHPVHIWRLVVTCTIALAIVQVINWLGRLAGF